MKLYATTTSERASKGQGGNKELRIKLEVEHDTGEREVMGDLFLIRNDPKEYAGGNNFILTYARGRNGIVEEVDKLRIKGKKQKGECRFNRGEICGQCD